MNYGTGGKFTMYLWEVMELTGDTGNGYRIGLDQYPIFDKDYRDPLNRKIIDHYFNREIGMESIPQFVHALSRRMNEVMPYWNQIYKSTLLEIDPFSTVNLKTLRDDETSEDGTTTSDGTNNITSKTGGRAINSDFPQSLLSGNADYASTGADNNGTASTDTTTGGKNVTSSKAAAKGNSTTSGYQGRQADMLMSLRSAFLNTDMLVIEGTRSIQGLDDCFMGVWDSGEEMLPGSYGIGYNGMLGLGMGYYG
jgi:hypothetical protein